MLKQMTAKSKVHIIDDKAFIHTVLEKATFAREAIVKIPAPNSIVMTVDHLQLFTDEKTMYAMSISNRYITVETAKLSIFTSAADSRTRIYGKPPVFVTR